MHRLLRRPTLTVALVGLLAFGTIACAPQAQKSGSSLLAQVNAQRANAGVGPLAWCPALSRAAYAHSGDQASHNAMSHTGTDGSDTAARAARFGYAGWTALAENVAAGYNSEAEVLNAWMNSSGHRANILSPILTHMGSGSAVSGNGTRYWTQDFGRSGTC